MARWKVLVNQTAGRWAVTLEAVRGALVAAGVEADLVVPATRDEATLVLQEAAKEGVTHFALVGGDGTVNLAANALLQLSGIDPPVIGVLPAGTGCDLLRTFAIPQDLAGAARHLAGEAVYPIDVATLEGSWGLRYFVNVAQVGVGAAAVETAVKLSRRLGTMRYPIAFAARLTGFPRARVKVETERRAHESDALAVILANAQFFAGGWNVAPKATLIDGVIDVQVISAHKRQAPALVPKVIRGTHLVDRSVRRFTAARYEIDTDIPWPLEADGDIVGNTPVKGRVLAAALRLKI